MAAHKTWATHTDEQGVSTTYAFVLEVNDSEVSMLEFLVGRRGKTFCAFAAHDTDEFQASLEHGEHGICMESDLVIAADTTRGNDDAIATLEEIEEFKHLCRAWMESNEAMSTVFYGKQYRELRVFAENEQVVHDIGVGDPVYVLSLIHI